MALSAGERARRLALLATLTALALAALTSSASSLAPAPEPSFCDRMIVAKVPWYSWEEPKPDGRLGFGPPNIRMRVLPRLIPTGGTVGYELVLAPGAQPAHPRWKIRTHLGRLRLPSLHVFLEEKNRQVRTVSRSRRSRFFFKVPDEPAYYFVTVQFTSLADRPLGRFRFYFRVIPPARKARLVLDTDSYSRGQAVLGRIENHGTEPAQYGAPYRIERYEGTSWSLAPESPDSFILPSYSVQPGESGSPCSLFQIPSSMAPGRYRMVKEVQFGQPEPELRILAGEFNVLP